MTRGIDEGCEVWIEALFEEEGLVMMGEGGSDEKTQSGTKY